MSESKNELSSFLSIGIKRLTKEKVENKSYPIIVLGLQK
jgi:hypothetical protein